MQEHGPNPREMGLSENTPPPSFETTPKPEQARREFEADKLKINALVESLGNELTKDLPDTARVGHDLKNLGTFLKSSQDALRHAGIFDAERNFFLHVQEEQDRLEQIWRIKQMKQAA